VEEIWQNKEFSNQMSSSVRVGDYLYGAHTNNVGKRRENAFTCLDWKTGEVKWREESTGMAQVLVVDGKLLIVTADGELILAEADPSGFKALGRASILGKRVWAHHAYNKGVVYARRNSGEAVAVRLAPAN
jgi:outer membrane protein assembly factor BamB